jgi:hypothetical protein
VTPAKVSNLIITATAPDKMHRPDQIDPLMRNQVYVWCTSFRTQQWFEQTLMAIRFEYHRNK